MDQQLLNKFIQGACSPEEVKKVLDWSKSEKFEQDLGTFFDQHWAAKDTSDHQNFQAEVLFAQIQSQIKLQQHEERSIESVSKLGRIIGWPKLLKQAVVLTLIIVFGFLAYQTFLKSPALGVEQISKSTTKGQKSTFFLADGSKVILNSESVLTFPAHFSDSSREIKLSGEAYFEVAKNKNKPFSVTANDIVITALGTSFNIHTGDDNVTVSLGSGKVLVSEVVPSQETEQHILNPGEKITYYKQQAAFVKAHYDYKDVFLWKEGIIYFNDASFEQVVSRLEAWYNVRFEITNRPEKVKPYTGEFNNQSLENVLEGMSFSLDFDYLINGEKTKIDFN